MRTAALRAGTREAEMVVREDQLVAGRLLLPFPVAMMDASTMESFGQIFRTAEGHELFPAPPTVTFLQSESGANKIAEICFFTRGLRGIISQDALAPGTNPIKEFAYQYRMRLNWVHADTFAGANPTMFLGIAHGSLGSQPWALTSTGVIAQLRLNVTSTSPPWNVQLVYGPGGGVAYTVQNIYSYNPASGTEPGLLLELVIDYPNLLIEGWVDGVKRGEMAMSGWNNTRFPQVGDFEGGNLGPPGYAGAVPWFSAFLASGSNAGAQMWYNGWNGIEMEIPYRSLTA